MVVHWTKLINQILINSVLKLTLFHPWVTDIDPRLVFGPCSSLVKLNSFITSGEEFSLHTDRKVKLVYKSLAVSKYCFNKGENIC